MKGRWLPGEVAHASSVTYGLGATADDTTNPAMRFTQSDNLLDGATKTRPHNSCLVTPIESVILLFRTDQDQYP
jgi:hypothetical protein